MAGSRVAQNRKAGFDVEVTQKFEAGLILTGDEIKSIREGRAQISGGYVKLLKATTSSPIPVVIGLHLSKAANPERVRTLLLHKKEVRELQELLSTKGKTAVALSVYLSHGWAKVTIGVGSGRKAHDKRNVIKKRDQDRQMRSSLKDGGRG